MESKLQQQAPQKTQTNKPNLTGIPTQMKLDFERRSGLSFDDVRVHYNSDKPAQLQALAYTQGTQVYVGHGQERYLRHELGHVIQQKSGRVHPIYYFNGISINDLSSLEREADRVYTAPQTRQCQLAQSSLSAPIQCKIDISYDDGNGRTPWEIKKGNRPNFPSSIYDTFTDVLSPEDLGYAKKRTVDHIISYHTINLLLRGILYNQLNSPSGTPKKEKKQDALSKNLKTSASVWYDLMRMIIPKKTDYIVLHNLWEMESIIGRSAYALKHPKKTSDSDVHSKTQKLFKAKENYMQNLESQRISALQDIDLICSLLAGREVNRSLLNDSVNEFENLLNCSIGNLRLGDSSTNETISKHIDPLANSFELRCDRPGEYTITFNDSVDQVEGEWIDPAGKFEFHSKRKSMAKRLNTLLKLDKILSNNSNNYINGTELSIPSFLLSLISDGFSTKAHVYTSDIVQDTKGKFNLASNKLKIDVIHQGKKKTTSYSADIVPVSHTSTGKKPKGYNTFKNITGNIIPTSSTSTPMSLSPVAKRTITIDNSGLGFLNAGLGKQIISRYAEPLPEESRTVFADEYDLASPLANDLISVGTLTNDEIVNQPSTLSSKSPTVVAKSKTTSSKAPITSTTTSKPPKPQKLPKPPKPSKPSRTSKTPGHGTRRKKKP